jgi:hypothetical protein
MEESKSMADLTCKAAGSKGGKETKRKYGSEWYSKIGKTGGQTCAARHGPEFYSEISRKGAERLKELVRLGKQAEK